MADYRPHILPDFDTDENHRYAMECRRMAMFAQARMERRKAGGRISLAQALGEMMESWKGLARKVGSTPRGRLSEVDDLYRPSGVRTPVQASRIWW